MKEVGVKEKICYLRIFLVGINCYDWLGGSFSGFSIIIKGWSIKVVWN